MAAVLFIVFIVAVLIGVPIAFALGAGSIVVMHMGGINLLVLVQRTFATVDSFSLLAVPYFVLAGNLMSRGAMSKALINFCESFLGFIKGGLSIISVVSAMFFAAVSGSGSATTAAVGATMVPELKARGYDDARSITLIAAAGCIGPIIPPSILMVLYGTIAEVSVTDLFKNGFAPGIAIGLFLIAFSIYEAYKYNYPQGDKPKLAIIWETFKQAIIVLIMPLIILGGIFSGIFTPTEAAAVAVAYSLIICLLVYRDMTMKELVKILLDSAMTTGMIMIIVALSGVFSWVLAKWKIADAITNAFLAFTDSKYVILFLISIVIIIAGVFLDTAASVLLLTPVFLPLLEAYGINLVHFGVAFVIGTAVGMLTPPVAMNLFVGSSISGVKLERMIKVVWPYLGCVAAVFYLYLYLPVIFPALIFE